MTNSKCMVRAAAALFMLIATACASGGSSSGGGRCQSELATSSESLDAVLDSAAAVRGLDVVWPDGAGRVLATVRAESSDVTDPVQIHSRSLTDDQEAGIEDVLRESSRMLFGSDARAHLVVGDENGPAL
ncbi:MAG: hypothetical protein R3253_14180, partial [Longimicrobiales bacterium]|nr:hypothetical protein [Longimicrobiales bacterium]